MAITLPEEVWASLIDLADRDRVYLEGNILKVIDPGSTPANKSYLDAAVAADKQKREKRMEVTKKVQAQNRELIEAQEEIKQSQSELEDALSKAETARQEAENDLDYMQKRTQFELMGNIVRVALWVIVGVGCITTGMYAVALFGPATNDADTTLLANTWSNMFGILLTNSFSIIGTIMGVKYATEGRGDG